MNLKKFQRYYIRILFKLKIATDKINAIQIFKRKFGQDVDFKLTHNDDHYNIKVDGKTLYNLPNKKIDIITNFKSIDNGTELLNEELNTELYLENNRAYFLLQNFTNK